MRFKSHLPAILLLSTAVYILYLGITNQLRLYIHPRYITFTFVMAALCLMVIFLNQYFVINGFTYKKNGLLYVLSGVVLVALLLPARTLTSSTVSQRSVDAGSITALNDTASITELYSQSTKGLKMNDWSRLLENNTDPAFYANKPAKISGFVYDAGLGDNTVWLARFILTCCAVDARPIGIPVQIENWQAEYSEDEWVEVEGSFKLGNTDTGEQLVLIPDAIQKIAIPENPYAN